LKASVSSPRDRLELVKPQIALKRRKPAIRLSPFVPYTGPWYGRDSAGIPHEIRSRCRLMPIRESAQPRYGPDPVVRLRRSVASAPSMITQKLCRQFTFPVLDQYPPGRPRLVQVHGPRSASARHVRASGSDPRVNRSPRRSCESRQRTRPVSRSAPLVRRWFRPGRGRRRARSSPRSAPARRRVQPAGSQAGNDSVDVLDGECDVADTRRVRPGPASNLVHLRRTAASVASTRGTASRAARAARPTHIGAARAVLLALLEHGGNHEP
jgi:hypothetical protein